jgi:hypothetical protein
MVGWRVYFGLRNVISGEQPSAAAGSPCPTAPHANVPFRSSPAFALPTTRKPFQASPFLPDLVAILVGNLLRSCSAAAVVISLRVVTEITYWHGPLTR